MTFHDKPTITFTLENPIHFAIGGWFEIHSGPKWPIEEHSSTMQYSIRIGEVMFRLEVSHNHVKVNGIYRGDKYGSTMPSEWPKNLAALKPAAAARWEKAIKEEEERTYTVSSKADAKRAIRDIEKWLKARP